MLCTCIKCLAHYLLHFYILHVIFGLYFDFSIIKYVVFLLSAFYFIIIFIIIYLVLVKT